MARAPPPACSQRLPRPRRARWDCDCGGHARQRAPIVEKAILVFLFVSLSLWAAGRNLGAVSLAALERLRVAHHEEHGLCQTLQNREIALVKSKGLCGENLQHSNYLTLVADGCGH